MKQYLKFVITVLIMVMTIFEVIVLGILQYPKGVFYSSYQSVISDKYRILQNTNEPKIIVVSGSSSAFGLDQKMLEEETGYRVANLGLHAGFGHLFYSELAKENINAGDIVLLAYEYDWYNGFNGMGQDLIMTGIDNNIDMYKHIPITKWPEFIGYIFKFAEKKNTYNGASGIYSREAFDCKTGQMVMERQYDMNYSEEIEKYGCVDLTDVVISDNAIEYLKDFKSYVESKGADVYFVAPPVLKAAVTCDYSEFDSLRKQEEEQIGIPYISEPTDYFFENELMSNAIYHCSNEGEEARTQLLINDLKRAAVIE